MNADYLTKIGMTMNNLENNFHSINIENEEEEI